MFIKRLIKNLLFLIAVLAASQIVAQPLNDECVTAINLTELTSWCSTPGAYASIGATASPQANPVCFPMADANDVWFSFVAEANTINITVNGASSSSGGSLMNPQFVLYSGSCGNLVEEECASDNAGNNIIESFAGPLTIGQTYYIRVDARNENEGIFQLCLNNYNQVPDPQQDCNTAVILCDKSPFTVQSVVGFGQQEVDVNTCMQGESASTWYKWTCDTPGTLGFTLSPSNATDDLDFIVYQLPNGIDNCSNKELLRCMASGENVGQPFDTWEPCTGPTGLSIASADLEETPGCASGDDNFVSAIDMVAGQSYALVVNNFSNTGNGFSIEFNGTGTFLGPEADFSINPPEGVPCDDDPITVTDASFFNAGNIVGWSWNFGNGANPQTANTVGPHTIFYNSIGTKSIALTIETDEGCIVTTVLEVEVSECCAPPFDLIVVLDDLNNPVCAGEANGSIFVSGIGGNPDYEFSIDGVNWSASSAFYDLPAGEHTILIRDIKGCEDMITVTLVDPPLLEVDAGEDQTIVLGDETQLMATVFPSGGDYLWSPVDSLSCLDCLTPMTDVTNTTTYTLTATGGSGCTASDDVTIFVNKIRPIYIPNVFSPNFDGINDFFTAYGNVAAREIVVLRIFNRWGALMYEGRNLPLGDERMGWDGTFKGQAMTPDVFAFYAVIGFIDGVEILYEGDVTILK